MDVTGNVELAGALNVYLIDSFELLAGMSFDILKVAPQQSLMEVPARGVPED